MKYDKKRTGEGLALVMVGDGLRAVRVDDLERRRGAGGRLPLCRTFFGHDATGRPRADDPAASPGGRASVRRTPSSPRRLHRYREQIHYLAVGGWNTLFGYLNFVVLYYFLDGVCR